MRRFIIPCMVWVLLGTLGWLALGRPAEAQTDAGTLRLTVDAGSFPEMRVYLSVNDARGARIPELPASAFALAESQQPIAGFQVAETVVGTQIAFVLDTSAAFKARDSNGVTRLEHVQQALIQYAQIQMQTGVDDVTVLAPENALIGHSSSGREVAAVVQAYTTDFLGAADPLAVFNAGLDYAASIPPRSGMPAMLVIISNGEAPGAAGTGLNDLIVRATAAGVQIHTVFIGPLGAGNTAPAQTLRTIAQATGGSYTVYESDQDFERLFQLLTGQRIQYEVAYRSRLNSTAQHTLEAHATVTTGVSLSATTAFPLRVEPPAVTLDNFSAVHTLTAPGNITIPFLLDFPDHHPRTVVAAQLLVNGEPASPPATGTALSWPVSAGGVYTLAVQVTDELGLTGFSAASAVSVNMVQPTATATPRPDPRPAAQTGQNLALGMGALALLTLTIGGGWLWRRKRTVTPATPIASILVTQPLRKAAPLPKTAPLIRPRLSGGVRRLPARFRKTTPGTGTTPPSLAFLEVVEAGGGGKPHPDIDLMDPVIRLGRDGAEAEVVFHDRSVSRLHARLERDADGVFRIFDEGSTSGTWVNFTAVAPGESWELKSGDLINLGRVQLRFKRRDDITAPTSGTPTGSL